MRTDVAALESDQQSRARVFISYSRSDVVFVDRLEAALKERGIAPLIDRADIYAFEEWWKRIEGLIAGADTVVFVLTRSGRR
jgi:TIR domain